MSELIHYNYTALELVNTIYVASSEIGVLGRTQVAEQKGRCFWNQAVAG